MTVTIAMPQLGLTMTEATVGTWLKKPGDAVRKDEPLLSISTDKVDMDVESNVDGVLRDILGRRRQDGACGNSIGAGRCSGQRPLRLQPSSSSPAAVASSVPAADGAQAHSGGRKQSPDRQGDRKEDASETFRSSRRRPARRQARRLGIDIATVKGMDRKAASLKRIYWILLRRPQPPRPRSHRAGCETAPVDRREHDGKRAHHTGLSRYRSR